MIRLFLSTGLLFLVSSCTSVETFVTTGEDNSVTMKSVEDSFFSSPKEKLKFVFKDVNGGKIDSISWEGVKYITDCLESYPNPEMDFKNLSSRVLDDGTGLIIVDSKIRNLYQLRRSYSLIYDDETEEHILEVIYNVKNYSSEKAMKQKWEKALNLAPGLHTTSQGNHVIVVGGPATMKIAIAEVDKLNVITGKDLLVVGNRVISELGTKERLSWKVQYILKD